MITYRNELINSLNQDIESNFNNITKISADMKLTFEGVSRLVMIDRYSQKDLGNETLKIGDLVVCVVKEHPKFPSRGIGYVTAIDGEDVYIELEEDSLNQADDSDDDGIIIRGINTIDKPLEIFYEQIASRVSKELSIGESEEYLKDCYEELSQLNLIPAGRVLFGAGSPNEVTYFNCFVMPFMKDSRGGISEHRKEVLEIMSRGGGVGTNGSTLRPRHALARGVNGKSSGAVSWLNDLSQLTHLVEQGGSRRGAQMIMLADWHPDIIEFIVSKMQNPNILKFIRNTTKDRRILEQVENKLIFTPLTREELEVNREIVRMSKFTDNLSDKSIEYAKQLLEEGGRYSVNDSECLTGANISVAITKEFMAAVENDEMYSLRFPDVDNYSDAQKSQYNKMWHDVGDVREWEKLGYAIKEYYQIRARELWDLINVCATYSAEPGIFFIDNANDETNAKSYGMKVVTTNPCGEQPLAPYSVCNLAAINLANYANRDTKEVLWDKLAKTINVAVRAQDNVIDRTKYFLAENEKQALGERRVGLGVMGLHDLLIWCGIKYGSEESIEFLDKLFEFIAISSYKTSVELSIEKGPFPFLVERGSYDALANGKYVQKLPEDLIERIRVHGLRNSHLLTIAPTGSTGTMVGVSTGLEPYFGFKYFRSGRLGQYIEVTSPIVQEYVDYHGIDENNLPDIFVSAMQLSPKEHVDVQCIIQKWIDSSISKTVNAPKGYTVKQVEEVYLDLYKGGAKGGTVYVDGSRDSQVLTMSKEDPEQLELQLDVEEIHTNENKKAQKSNMNIDRQDRNIGNDIGDICPICLEGTVEDIGGCNTCTNCNIQLKCGL